MPDLHRTGYHFQPKQNWMNDPNGPVWLHDGLHLFYQYNPFGAAWGNMTWGHARTSDLLHWQELPPALHPDAPYDKDGVYSGCCAVVNGLPHILYTGVQPEVQCLAVGDALATHFDKAAENPVIPAPPFADASGFRDPFVWKEGDVWKLVLGSGHKGKGGAALLYQSRDWKTWEYLGPLCEGDDPANDMWECPNFLPFDDGTALLLVSLIGRSEVAMLHGPYDGKHLQARSPRSFDLGDSYYASNAVTLPDGRRLLLGWLRETVSGRAEAGWQGVQCLPRLLELNGDGQPCVRPLPELVKLREKKLFAKKDFTVRSGDNPFAGLRGRQLEILLRFEAGANTLYLELARGPKGVHKAVLAYDGASDTLHCDCAQAGGKPTPCGDTVLGQGVNELRVFLDGSVLEVYINNQETLTTRLYPGPDEDGLRLYASGGVRMHQCSIWIVHA